MVAVATTKGVGSGCFGLVSFSWVGAAVTFVCVGDIPTVRPTIIFVVVVVLDFSSGAIVVVVLLSWSRAASCWLGH
jgi:hypothetical protein